MWLTIPQAIAVAFALVPAYLIIRQLVRPVEEPSVTWPRAVLAPTLAGLVAGVAAWLIAEVVEGTGLGPAMLALAIAPPAIAVGAGLALKFSGTPRPWLTGFLGVQAGVLILSYASDFVPAHVLLYAITGATGLVWAALVLGPTIAPVARLTVYVLLLLSAVATYIAQPVLRERDEIRRFESIGVPLLVPELPGYKVTHAYADPKTSQLSVHLHITSGDSADYTWTITVEGIPVPSKFAPPENCGPEFASVGGSVPCTAVGDQLWRRERYSTVIYLVRRDNSLYFVSGSNALDTQLRQAAMSLRPVTAKELAAVS